MATEEQHRSDRKTPLRSYRSAVGLYLLTESRGDAVKLFGRMVLSVQPGGALIPALLGRRSVSIPLHVGALALSPAEPTLEATVGPQPGPFPVPPVRKTTIVEVDKR